MLDPFLPYIGAAIVAFITAYGAIRVGKEKNRTEINTSILHAGDSLRDDLQTLVDKCEIKVERMEKHNEELQSTVYALRLEVNALRLENQVLRSQLETTQAELNRFERKVYYNPPKKDS